MKKLLLMLAAVAAVTFVSCDNNANKTTEGADSTTVAAYNVDQLDSLLANTTDTTAIQAMLNDANTEVQRLTEAGDTEGAKTLLEKIKEIVAKNKEKLAAAIPNFNIDEMVNKVVTVPESLKDVVNAAGDSIKGELVDAAKEKVEDAKAAVNEKAGEVVDKANEKVAEGVDKAKDAANKAADATKDAAKDAAKKIGL